MTRHLIALLWTVTCCASHAPTEQPEPLTDYSSWSAARVRAQFPGETAALDCVTVWVIPTAPNADACVMSTDGYSGSVCVSDADPLILYRMPHPMGSCTIEIASCDAVRCGEP